MARSLVVAMAFGVFVPPVATLAASCSNPAHQTTLSSGGASPGSGTTSTQFTFSVTYTDSKNCPPTSITVTIAGVGTFGLGATSTTYSAGVVFRTSRTVPAGSHAYSFAASSGSGGGMENPTLTSVSPATVVVSSPTPPPTPPPTPKPTPKPTPRATPRATPKPTPKPTPKATPRATPKPTTTSGTTASPGSSASPGTTPPLIGGVGGGTSPSARPGSGQLPSAFPGSGGDPGPAAIILATLLTGLTGIGLFLLLVTKPWRRRQLAPAGGSFEGDLSVASVDAGPSAAAWALPPDTPLEEATIPRWRRPSLQSARQAPSRGIEPTYIPTRFAAPPADGVERRRISYRLVRLASIPDEMMGDEVARLDRGDEVELIRAAGAYWLVRTPAGFEGWVHEMTLNREPLTEDDE